MSLKADLTYAVACCRQARGIPPRSRAIKKGARFGAGACRAVNPTFRCEEKMSVGDRKAPLTFGGKKVRKRIRRGCRGKRGGRCGARRSIALPLRPAASALAESPAGVRVKPPPPLIADEEEVVPLRRSSRLRAKETAIVSGSRMLDDHPSPRPTGKSWLAGQRDRAEGKALAALREWPSLQSTWVPPLRTNPPRGNLRVRRAKVFSTASQTWSYIDVPLDDEGL
jgi:hypothetical protein